MVSKFRIIKLVYLALTFIIVYYFLPLYTDDDQYLYNLYYNELDGLNFYQAFELYSTTVGASEPLYFILTYLSHSFLDKISLILLVNMLFAYVIASYILKYEKPELLFYCITNFYLLALFFSHERLKLAALVFLFLSDKKYFNESIKKVMVILTHFQFMILYIPDFVKYSNFKKSKLGYSMGVIGFAAVLYIFKDVIVVKFEIYSAEMNLAKAIESIIKIFIMTIVGLAYSTNRKKYLMSQFFIFLASMAVGGDRIVIFSYAILMHSYLSNNKIKFIKSMPIHVINLYFSLKGVQFLMNIIDHGHGF